MFRIGYDMTPEEIFNLATKAFGEENLDLAISLYEQVLTLCDGNESTLLMLGIAYCKKKQFDIGIAYFDRLLLINPKNISALSNKGNALQELKQHELALSFYEKALNLDPNFLDCLSNKGVVLQRLRHFKEALDAYRAALKIRPNDAKIHLNIGLCCLLMGDFVEGWREHEWRLSANNLVLESYQIPRWDGLLSLQGKTIFLTAEQGFGDMIQFIRFVKLLANSGAKIVVEVFEDLRELFCGIKEISELVSYSLGYRGADYVCPLMSLGFLMNIRLSDIPKEVPYLFSDGAKKQEWEIMLGKKNKPRIGVVWSGSKIYGNDLYRSIDFKIFSQLFIDDFEWYVLQKECRDSDYAALVSEKRVKFFGERLIDFSDTAALLDCMDLVISTDTSVAHLAGAMGKKIWILLPVDCDWRWLLDREDSPWYPTTRLFRQTKYNQWTDVIRRVQDNLRGEFGGVHSFV